MHAYAVQAMMRTKAKPRPGTRPAIRPTFKESSARIRKVLKIKDKSCVFVHALFPKVTKFRWALNIN